MVDALERGIVVFFARHLEELPGVADAIRKRLERVHDGFERLTLLAEVLSALRIVPDVGVFRQSSDFAQTDFLLVEVKDTSATEPRDLRRPSAAWK
jgi:hypothetical protein